MFIQLYILTFSKSYWMTGLVYPSLVFGYISHQEKVKISFSTKIKVR